MLGNRYLRSIAACTGSSNLFSNIAFATFLLFVVQDLHLEPLMIGVVFGLGNIGALFGAVMANRIGGLAGVGPTIVGTAMFAGVAGLLIPLATPALAVPMLIASSALGGFSNVVYNITQISFRQAITPPGMQGRMNATMRFIVWGTIPIGAIIGGALATSIGIHQAIWVGAILGLTPFLFVLLSPVRRLKEMPQPVGDAAVDRPHRDAARGGDRSRTWRSPATRASGSRDGSARRQRVRVNQTVESEVIASTPASATAPDRSRAV